MRRQHDRLLPAQQTRQHRMPARREIMREIGRHDRQRARQDVREDQIVAVRAQHGAAIADCMADPHQPRDAVARGIMAGDRHRAGIDVARQHRAAQQFRRGDRQNPGAGADVERMADGALPRQRLECHQTAAGRGMLAGAESGRRVEQDADSTRWRPTAIMRAVDKEAADPHRWKSQLVLREPVAVGQRLFVDFKQLAASSGCGERQPCGQLRA